MNGVKPRKFQLNDTYFAGTETTEMVGKLTRLKKKNVNYIKCAFCEHKYEGLLYQSRYVTGFVKPRTSLELAITLTICIEGMLFYNAICSMFAYHKYCTCNSTDFPIAQICQVIRSYFCLLITLIFYLQKELNMSSVYQDQST
jgi:hypothetical protein